ncbi:MAG: hypothetical protein LIP01_04720 [Tannerellaceae bacterium]|nr:hypothetical protein [Tannerellaceae bacterium]
MISLMLCLVMILSLSVPALAADENANKITIDSPAFCADVIAEMADSLEMKADESDLLDLERSFYLYNFNNEPIAIFYQLSPVGYAIYDYAGTTVLEYTKEANHPFYTNPNQRYYYEGVFGYYEAVANGFRNLATGQIKSINADYRFDSSDFYHGTENNDGMVTRASENPVYLDNDTRLYDCNTSSNLSYFYPNLSQEDLDDCPGICGSLTEVYKGLANVGDTLEVVEEGGQEGKVMGGLPQLNGNNDYILFLTEYNGCYYICGAFQGRFIEREGYMFQQATEDTKLRSYTPVSVEDFSASLAELTVEKNEIE